MSGMSGGLHFDQPASGQRTVLVADNPRKLLACLIFFLVVYFSPALYYLNAWNRPASSPIHFFSARMKWTVCVIILVTVFFLVFSYRYCRTLSPSSLSLPSSPPSATSLLLPPCHHHCNYWYIVVKQPVMIFPQTGNRIRKSGTLVILSLSILFFCYCLFSP